MHIGAKTINSRQITWLSKLGCLGGLVLFVLVMNDTYLAVRVLPQERFPRLRQLIRDRIRQPPEQANQYAPTGSGLIEGTVQCKGTTRTYFLHTPGMLSAASPLPLILVFHGGGGTAQGMASITHLCACAESRRFIVVYPQGLDKRWNDGRQGVKTSAQVDDVAYILQLIDALEQKFPIDRSQVYACGLSNGGFFSQRLICELPNKIAAAASIGASMPADGACVPSQPAALMFILGTADPLVPFQGGQVKGPFGGRRGLVKAASATASYWIEFDGCPQSPRSNSIYDGGDGTSLKYESFGPGKGGSELVFCTVEGGGHCWPGGKQYLPVSIVGKASSVDGNKLILNFFARHRLPPT
jgi:polyhydroxybutyrate depolymerase